MQTRMKNLKTGAIIDYRFRAEEFVDRAILDEVEFEYLYNEGDDFHFMNTETYEQMHLSREELGETVYYLIPNTIVKVEFFEEKPIGVDLPDTMDLKVVNRAHVAKSHRQRGGQASHPRDRAWSFRFRPLSMKATGLKWIPPKRATCSAWNRSSRPPQLAGVVALVPASAARWRREAKPVSGRGRFGSLVALLFAG